MARISSASTITLTGYLTEKGRDYLSGFGNEHKSRRIVNGEDMFKPTKFSLYDSDTNYKTTKRIDPGDPIALAGSEDNKCLKTIANQVKKNNLGLMRNLLM